MLARPFVFVDVDTQRDFLEPDGALFVAGSEGILKNLAALTAFARTHEIPVIATACAHTEADVDEIALFGRHCMVGTRGQARVEATAWPDGLVVAPDAPFVATAETPALRHVTLEKRDYDVFTARAAGDLVAHLNRSLPWFVVYGVATDYCVKAAVLGLRKRGCKVAVVVDAIHAIDVAREPEILAEFTAAGALLTLTEAVCSASV